MERYSLSGIAQKPADTDLAAGNGSAGTIRQLDDQAGIGSDAHGQSLVLPGGADDLHTAADGAAAAGQFPDEVFGRLGKNVLAEEEVIQAGDDAGGDGRAGDGDAGFPHRDGFIPQFFGEVLPLLGDIDTDADDRAIDGAAFGIAGEFGESSCHSR